MVRQQVGSPDVLVPPPPPLTRYKREIAVQAEEMEAAAGARERRACRLLPHCLCLVGLAYACVCGWWVGRG